MKFNFSTIKETTQKDIFVSEEYIIDKINSVALLRPNISAFKNLNFRGLPLNKFVHFTLKGENALKIHLFKSHDKEMMMNSLINYSSDLGGYSVSLDNQELYDESVSFTLTWPAITLERIEKCKKKFSIIENELLDHLRDLRGKCKKKLFFNEMTKEERIILDKYLEENFIKEKNKIINLVDKLKKNILN